MQFKEIIGDFGRLRALGLEGKTRDSRQRTVMFFLSTVQRCNWHKIQQCIRVRCATYWFETLIYCNIITTVALLWYNLIQLSLSHNYHFFRGGGREHLRSILSNFQVCNTVLWTVIIMLGTRSPKGTYLLTGSLYPFTNISLILPCPPDSW